MSEPGWSPQFMPGGSGDVERRRIQATDIDEDEMLWKATVVGGAAVAVVVISLLWPDAYPFGVMLKGAALGVGTGLMAVGLVLIYRTTRIINFSYAAMGGFSASVGIGLHQGQDVPWLVAVPIGVVLGVLVGGLVERFVIRRFVRAPRLVLTVATIGLAQLFGGLALFVPGWFGLAAVNPGFDTPLTDSGVKVGVVRFDGNDMLLMATVPIVLGGLIWFLRFTEAGIAVRGMAENMDRARLLGIPVNQLSLLLWSIAGGIAAMTVLLQAPNEGLPIQVLSGPELLLPALAAAVVARLTSMSLAFSTGVGLGVLDQAVLWNFPTSRTHSFDLDVLGLNLQWDVGVGRELTYVVFFAVIVGALLLQRRTTNRTDAAEESSWSIIGATTKLPRRLAALPEVRLARLACWGLLLVVLVYIPAWGSGAQVLYATVTLTFALAALSLVVLTGWGGVVSLGQMALVGVGGLAAANLVAQRNTDLFLTIGVSAVAGGLVALLIGLPALRVVGQYLAVTTLAFAVMMEQYIVKPAINPDLFPGFIQRPELWGRVALRDERWLYVLALALVVLVAAAIANLRRARPGRSIAAARDNERGAAAVGISSVETRLAVFVFAGMFAGVAGALHALVQQRIGEDTYPASMSLLLFSMAVIGGMSSIGGTLAGVGVIQWAGWVLPDRFQILITGVGLLIILMVVPGGLGQAFERLRDRFAMACARRRGMALIDELETIDHSPSSDRWKPPASMLDTAAVAPPPPAAIPPASMPPPGIPPPAQPSPLNGWPAPMQGHPGHPAPGYPAPNAAGAYSPPLAPASPPLLACEAVESSYGSFQVLFGIDTTVAHSEMLALLGTNGAGKSTLLKSLSGLLPPDSGRISFAGQDITNMPAEKVARLGLSLMPGGRGVFPTLTVAENMRLASWMIRHNRRMARKAREEALDLFPVLRKRWTQMAGNLSGGEQQQLSLAMALATKPKLLCIDELSLGLAPSIVGQLVEKVKEIHASGTAVVVVEQSVNVALLLCERAVFLEKGQVRFRGPTAGLLDRPDVLRAVFLGNNMRPRTGPVISPPAERPSRATALECIGLVKRFGGIRAVDAVDLVVPPASILGLIGHNGAGKTTLFDVINGFLAADGGRVILGGKDITKRQPHQRAVVSLGRSFQEARLFPSLTVSEVLMVALETHLSSRDPLAAAMRLPASTISERRARARVDQLIEMLGLEFYRDRPTAQLSTGTRRIVELGCLLAHDPAVVLLDEPSGGVAQREAEALGPLLRRVQIETGCSLVVIEHDMALVSALCDALVALEQGAVVATGPPHEVLANERVIASYLGTNHKVVHRSSLEAGGFGMAVPWRGHSPAPPRPQWLT